MKVSDKITNTIMNDAQKAHIEWIAGRHNIAFLDRTLAMMIASTKGHDELLYVTNSFSVRNGHGDIALYLDESDHHDPEMAYFVALHELGHSILGHHSTNDESDDQNVSNEIAAWDWAITHAMIQPSDETLIGIQEALSTYTDGAEGIARPDSFLALTNPETWKKKGWDFKKFLACNKDNRDAEYITVSSDKATFDIPNPFANMLADWLNYTNKCEREKLKENVDLALQELAETLREHGTESPELYDIAKGVTHESGFDYTDPRTGETFPAPKKED